MSIHDYMYVTQDHRRYYEKLPVNIETDLYDRDRQIFPHRLNAETVDCNGYMPHTEPHCHEDFELLLFIEGSAVLHINSESYQANAGDLFVINPFDMHSLEIPADQPRFSRMVLIFDPVILEDSRYPASYNYIELLKTEMLKYCHKITDGGDVRFISEMMSLMKKSFPETNDAALTEVRGYLCLIFARLIRINHCGGFDGGRTPEDNDFIRRIHGFIREKFSENISTEDAANAMAYNKSYFCRRFRKYFDRSFTEYLNIYRIYRAKCLMISDKDIRISQLSDAVGFNTPAFFTRIFKKYTGVLPSGYLRYISAFDAEK